MKKLALLLGLFALLLFFGSASATTYTCGTCADCQSILQYNFTNGDTLLLNASINATGMGSGVLYCLSSSPISVNGNYPIGPTNSSGYPYDNVTIDCQGYTYDGLDVAGDIGIALGTYWYDAPARNYTVKNCKINSFATGIGTRNVYDLKIINTTIYNSGTASIGVSCGNSISPSSTLISGNTIDFANSIQLFVYVGPSCNFTNVTIKDNIFKNNAQGVFFNGIPCNSDISIYNNLFNSTTNFVLTSGNCTWNTTKTNATNIVGGTQIGGNYWAEPDGSGFSQICDNVDNDSFCDSPFAFSESNSDFLPLSLNYSEEPVEELNIDWITPANNSIVTINSITWKVSLSEPPINCYLSINGSANVSMAIQTDNCTYTSTSLANATTYCGIVSASDIDESNVSTTQCATTYITALPLINNLGQFSVVAGIIMGAGLLLFLLDAFFSGKVKDMKTLFMVILGAIIIISVITIFFV